MMDKELKTKWVKALRSGEYKQCKGQLRCSMDATFEGGETHTYCCLGVLACTLEDDCDWDGSWDHPLLPSRLRRKIGMSKSIQDQLVTLNDTCKWSFKKIAAWIEENA